MESTARPLLTFLGHSTVLIDMDGTQVITDPLLHARVGPIRRFRAVPDPALVAAIDAVLISHLHLDHLDFRSLEMLGREKRIIIPEGSEKLFAAHGFRDTWAPPFGPRGIPVGFIVAGSHRLYFAGDTGIFPGMADFAEPRLDVAMLPVWGWGPKLSEGHLHPASAAKALQYLKPTAAVPIHWGTLWPALPSLFFPGRFSEPPLEFAEHAARFAPDVRILVTMPGEPVAWP